MPERFVIRGYLHRDKSSVKRLTEEAFGPAHHKRSVWNLRKAKPIIRLGLIAEDMNMEAFDNYGQNERIVGSLQFWPIRIADYPSLLLGPLAVKEHLRGLGVGRMLIEESLKKIQKRNWHFCIVSGEPDYYPKFGFKPIPENLIWPGPIERQRLQYINLGYSKLETISNGPLHILSEIS